MILSNFFKKKQEEAAPVVVDNSPLFESKEDYLAMRQAWKDYINEGKHLEDDGRLISGHFLLYALLRDQDIYKGFSEVTSNIKLINGHAKYLGLIQARDSIDHAANNTYTTHYIDMLLKPFNGTVTKDMVIRMYDKVKQEKLGWA